MTLVRKNSGFTMVELLVVLAVTSIVLSLMYQVYHSQLKSHTTQQELVEMQQNLRATLYLMEREIRMAGHHGPNGGVADPSVTIAQVDNIAFAMDITGGTTLEPSDGDTADPGEQINYFLDGVSGELIRNAFDGNGNQTILSLRDIMFVYKDEDGTTLDYAALASDDERKKIRSVEILLNASIGPGPMVSEHEMELRSEIKCRNLGLN
jgi:type IV pilus assembly protein PilW